MPITINGTSGISGVDGTAGTPALQGTDTNTGISFGSDVILGSTGGTERFRVDSSGRLLVGTSSTSADLMAIVQGTSGGAKEGGPLMLARANAPAADGYEVGILQFAANNHVAAAKIFAARDSGTWTAGSSQPTRLVFSTTADGASSPTERLRINSSGQMLYGTTTKNITSPNNPGFEIHGTNTGGLGVYQANADNQQTSVVFQNTTGRVGFIDINNSSVTYSTSSDYRLKENIAPVADGIVRLLQLKPSRFNFITDPDNTVDGFIAHEVQDIVPEAISGEKDAIDDDGKPIHQGIDQSKLVPLLTAALQEAVAKIESLEARLTAAGI